MSALRSRRLLSIQDYENYIGANKDVWHYEDFNISQNNVTVLKYETLVNYYFNFK